MTEDAGAHGVPPPSANLYAYIPGDRRRALVAGTALPDRMRGAALFADISGFTPLTEALANELGAHRGAEEITTHLNRVFAMLVDVLHAHGGHVIYFSGDAITCWFDGDDGVLATACGLAMQSRMSEVRDVVTPRGMRVTLAMKVAVCVGEARRFIVGDPTIQRIDVLAGRLIDELADTERLAARGEVVLGPSAAAALGTRVEIGEARTDERGEVRVAVAQGMRDPAAPPGYDADVALADDDVKEWVLPPVYERAVAGREEFLAELRPAYPLFVRFGGIDYDNDADAVPKLDAFVCKAQRILTSYGGNLLHLTLGDKGAYLCAVFGAPAAHEDDAARAAAAALELRDLEAATAMRGLQIGIAYGRLRSGTYGHPQRRTFTCLGDAVNLAARLMATAPVGHIYASEPVQRAAGDAFAWEPLAPIAVKGKAEPVVASSLVAMRRAPVRGTSIADAPLIGRAAELATMTAELDQAAAGEGRVVAVSADAGMGKSRLASEFLRLARERGAAVAVGEAQAYGTNTAYFVWRPIFASLFDLDDAMPAAAQVEAVEAQLAAVSPSLAARAPLLGALLGLPMADNELTASFDAKLRKTSLEGMLVELVASRAKAMPVVLALEDCHWLDALSRDVLEALARAAPGMRLLLLLAYRPGAQAGGGLGIAMLPHFTEIALDELDRPAAAMLIRSRLAPFLDPGVEPPPALVEMVTDRAQGNPFYIEELLNFIRSRGVGFTDGAAIRKLELPESLHSLILSRIDALAEASRRPLKVASVLGRVFRANVLPTVYPDLGGRAEVDGQLATLASADLVAVDQEAERTWLFKHVVTQEVAYESMPFAFRSELHERVGRYIESTEPEAVERSLDLLAHHYSHSANVDKKREFLRRAGDAAQAAYANTSAIDYFERLLPLVEDHARVDVLLKLGKVIELLGNWKRAEEFATQALSLSTALGDDRLRGASETALAEVARKQGRFEETVERLDRAARAFEDASDESGLGLVKHLTGTLAAQRGEYDKAVESYEASLVIRERIGDKVSMGGLLSNLGIVAEYRGDYEASRRLHERALQLRADIGDRRGVGNSTTNLGMIALLQKQFADARDWFQKSMTLNREVGDAWMVALCDHNLANANRELGELERARGHYAASLRAYRSYDDPWALGFLLEDVALLLATTGDVEAGYELLGAADALRDANDMPRAPSRAHEIDQAIADSARGLGEDERAASRARGRGMTAPEALDYALRLCASSTA